MILYYTLNICSLAGGEKKRNEILQMSVLDAELSILDEIDSGLDIDALKDVASAVNGLTKPETATIMVTHYKVCTVPCHRRVCVLLLCSGLGACNVVLLVGCGACLRFCHLAVWTLASASLHLCIALVCRHTVHDALVCRHTVHEYAAACMCGQAYCQLTSKCTLWSRIPAASPHKGISFDSLHVHCRDC